MWCVCVKPLATPVQAYNIWANIGPEPAQEPLNSGPGKWIPSTPRLVCANAVATTGTPPQPSHTTGQQPEPAAAQLTFDAHTGLRGPESGSDASCVIGDRRQGHVNGPQKRPLVASEPPLSDGFLLED